jgi:hypothetical protein
MVCPEPLNVNLEGVSESLTCRAPPSSLEQIGWRQGIALSPRSKSHAGMLCIGPTLR